MPGNEMTEKEFQYELEHVVLRQLKKIRARNMGL